LEARRPAPAPVVPPRNPEPPPPREPGLGPALAQGLARVEERLNASERREMDLQIRVDDLRTERDQLGFDLAEARKPLLLRLLEALRRR